jgi:Reverse transcriptase (RNA-dependent DNA polymerase)
MAFTSKFGCYQYQVMPFRLSTAPAHLQRFINANLLPFFADGLVAYRDNIIMPSTTLKKNVSLLYRILETLRSNRLSAKKHKCMIFTHRIEFLGFVIGKDGISPKPSSIKTITNWIKP